MPQDDLKAWKVKIDPVAVGSTMQVFGVPGTNDVTPQRQVLHELIVQAVTERKLLEQGKEYQESLGTYIEKIKELPPFQALEQAANPDPHKISILLDEIGLDRLPLHKRAEQIMMVTGGPGTGKTSIVEDLASKQPEIYHDAAQINPDHYKDLLAKRTELGAGHGTYTHYESSMIADKIIGCIEERMGNGLPAPHVLMDVATPWPNYVEFAKKFDQMKAVTGTAPPEVTVQRAYKRGYESERVVGRVIPVNRVLEGAVNSSRHMPNVFDHKNLNFVMLNTAPDGKPLPVASWDNDARRLIVHDPDTFMDFVERQNINTAAESPGELFQGVDRSPQKLAQNLKPYTDKGIQIDLMKPDGEIAISMSATNVEVLRALESARGTNFMADVAKSLGKLGKNDGIVLGAALGTLSGIFTLAAGGTKAQAAGAVYTTAVPYGDAQINLVQGHAKAAARSASVETASIFGSMGGAAAGAVEGAAVGSAVPVIGTAAGGVAGGIIGGVGGGVAAGKASEYMIDHFAGLKDTVIHVSHEAAARLSAATQDVKAVLGSAWDWVAGTKKPELDMQAAFGKLPDAVKPGMPPEVASLVEVKKSPALFRQQFDELKTHGGLGEVVAYIDSHQVATTPAPGASFIPSLAVTPAFAAPGLR